MNIIIGGTHGLGQEIAARLHSNGEETFITGRSYNEEEHGPGMKVDLANVNQSKVLTAYIRGLGHNAIKGFYWVAGFGYNGDFAEQDNAHEMALANFANVVPVAQAAWQKMIPQTSESHFVVVSSTTGVRARKNEAVYAATKHAQVGFARSLGMESERLETRVKVALFLPGGMKSPFWDVKRPPTYDEFMDTDKVAQRIMERVIAQETPYYEEMIERGSL